MGGASAAFHAFAEATSGRYLRNAWADKIAAGFTNSASKSGDKLYSLNFMAALAAQHHMIWVGLGPASRRNALTAAEDDLNRLGFWIGAAASTPQDGGHRHRPRRRHRHRRAPRRTSHPASRDQLIAGKNAHARR